MQCSDMSIAMRAKLADMYHSSREVIRTNWLHGYDRIISITTFSSMNIKFRDGVG
jgi:hypothetical protein